MPCQPRLRAGFERIDDLDALYKPSACQILGDQGGRAAADGGGDEKSVPERESLGREPVERDLKFRSGRTNYVEAGGAISCEPSGFNPVRQTLPRSRRAEFRKTLQREERAALFAGRGQNGLRPPSFARVAGTASVEKDVGVEGQNEQSVFGPIVEFVALSGVGPAVLRLPSGVHQHFEPRPRRAPLHLFCSVRLVDYGLNSRDLSIVLGHNESCALLVNFRDEARESLIGIAHGYALGFSHVAHM